MQINLFHWQTDSTPIFF